MRVNLHVRSRDHDLIFSWYDRVNMNILLNIYWSCMDKLSPRDCVDLIFVERDMLSNCVKRKPDAWWLVILFYL